jgi:DNA-binding transcriptional ArsR family regulator
MRQQQSDIRQTGMSVELDNKTKGAISSDFVFEKNIFSNIFEKDVRRVFMYKKAERLAKAIHLIGPAFKHSVSLRSKLDSIAVELVEAAILRPAEAREPLSRALLSLSSVLAMARTSGTLSEMNADMIAREAHFLLQELAAYEDPRVILEDAPTLADVAKLAPRASERKGTPRSDMNMIESASIKDTREVTHKGQDKADTPMSANNARREAVLEVVRRREQASIKDISSVIRDVSEKTIQRELQALIDEGLVMRKGERRWSTYSPAL